MQGKVKIFKLTSKQFPDKVWDTPNHFVFTTESRQVAKDDKKFQKETNYDYYKQADLGGYYVELFLSDDKKSLYKIEVCNDELHEYNYEHYYKPHIEQNIWNVEETLSITADSKKTRALARIFFNAKSEYDQWMKDTKKI